MGGPEDPNCPNSLGRDPRPLALSYSQPDDIFDWIDSAYRLIAAFLILAKPFLLFLTGTKRLYLSLTKLSA